MNISVDTERQTPRIVYFLIFLYFLMSMRCWIGFGGIAYAYQYIFFVLITLLHIAGKVKLQFKGRYLAYAMIVFATLLLSVGKMSNLNGIIDKFVPAFGILAILAIPDLEKECLLSHIIKWFGIIILAGFPIYVLCQLGAIPPFGTIQADYGNNILGKMYNQYYFYLQPIERHAGKLVRFNSVFIEPGDLGCVSAFLLMAAQFNFKRYRYLWAVLLGLIASFSLAGYIMTMLAYLFILLLEGRISVRALTTYILFILVFYIIGTTWNAGDNVINNTILSRLQSDDEVGFTGNNRTSLLKLEYFYAMFNDTKVLLWGYDSDTIGYLIEQTGLGAGFVNKMIGVGLIGMIGLILPNLLITMKSTAKRYAWFFFIVFALYMYQRTEAFWVSLVICYVYGIVINELDNQKQWLQ